MANDVVGVGKDGVGSRWTSGSCSSSQVASLVDGVAGVNAAVYTGRETDCSSSSPADEKKASAAVAISAGEFVSVVTIARIFGGSTPARISFAIISIVIPDI